MRPIHYVPPDRPIWAAGRGATETFCSTEERPRIVTFDRAAANQEITPHRDRATCLDCIMGLAVDSTQRHWVQDELNTKLPDPLRFQAWSR